MVANQNRVIAENLTKAQDAALEELVNTANNTILAKSVHHQTRSSLVNLELVLVDEGSMSLTAKGARVWNALIDIENGVEPDMEKTATEDTLETAVSAPEVDARSLGMALCTPVELEAFRAVVLNPDEHGISSNIASMIPNQHSSGVRNNLLSLCGISHNEYRSERIMKDVFNVLWGHTFDMPTKTAPKNKKYQGVKINVDVHERQLKFWNYVNTHPKLRDTDPNSVTKLCVSDTFKACGIDSMYRDPKSLYAKLHYYACKADNEVMQRLWDARSERLKTNASQPKGATKVAKAKSKKKNEILMDSKKVKAALKKNIVVSAKPLAEDNFDGYTNQAEVFLGGTPIGTVGKSATIKGRSKWMSLDPETSQRFTSRALVVVHCHDVVCGDKALWEDDIEFVSVALDSKPKGSDSTRVYSARLYKDGHVSIKCTLMVDGTDEVTDLFGEQVTLSWHRLLEMPVRTKLAELLIPLSDWSLLTEGIDNAIKNEITLPYEVVEEEETEEEETEEGLLDIYADSPYDPTMAEFARKSHNVNLLMTRITEGELILDPDFQRNAGLWSNKAASRLIESILLGIPLPLFIFRELSAGVWQCVDGLQRLTSLKRFILEGAKLTNLEYLPLKGETFNSLHRKYQRKIQEAELSCVIIGQDVPISVTFNVFSRLNAGGIKLNRQELRHALNQGQATLLLRDLAQSPEFVAAISGGIASKRMQDREVVLRFIAFTLNSPAEYKGGMDQFLAKTMSQLNALSEVQIGRIGESFKLSMSVVENLLGTDAFRIHPTPQPERRSRINKAMFETWSVAFSNITESQTDILVDNRDDFCSCLLALITNEPAYADAVTAATSRVSAVQTRHATAQAFISNRLIAYAGSSTRSDKGVSRGATKKAKKKAASKKAPSEASEAPSKPDATPTPAKATEAPTEATQVPVNGMTESMVNNVPEFILSSINKDYVRTITRKVSQTGSCTVVLPTGTRVGIVTEKRKGSTVFAIVDLMTDERIICSKPKMVLEQLQTMA